MQRRWIMRAATAVAVACATAGAWGDERRPNVLLILVDDLGRQDLGVEGSAFHETPHIDALVRRSVRFSRGYSACQVCSPSRAAIQTGKAPARLGITDYIAVNGANQPPQWKRNTKLLPAAYRPELPLEEVTIAEALRAHGYRTFFAGKWHLGGEGFAPEDQGYEINKGGWHFGTPPGGFFAPYRNPRLDDDPPGTELSHRLARDTATFIRDSAARSAPFFAMLSFYDVHAPIQCAEARWRTFRDKAERLGLTARAEPRFTLDRTQEVRQVQDHPVYAGMMAALDDAVGLVLESNGGCRGRKGSLHEGGLRVPMIARWPGRVAAGVKSPQPWSFADVLPTLADLAGARPPTEGDGVSIAATLRGEPQDLSERTIYWERPAPKFQQAARRGRWKVVRPAAGAPLQRFDLAADPGEAHDLAAEQPEITADLARYLATARVESPHWPDRLLNP